MTLWLTHDHLQSIVNHAYADQPHEACGILVGHRLAGISRVTQIIPCLNRASDTRHHFVIAPEAITAALAKAGDKVLIGFYHSHPRTNALPSLEDARTSSYADAVHLIIGLRPDVAMTAWRFNRGDADRVPVHIGDDRPLAPERAPQSSQVAVIGALVLSALILIGTAIALLPPAPPIPR